MALTLAPHIATPPTPAHLPLFCEAFGIDENEGDAILASLAQDAVALTAEEEGIPVSQGFLLPMMLGGHFGYYLYALATAPAYRGQGYLSALLTAAKRYAEESGADFLLLIPADERLAATYRRHGFRREIGLSATPDGNHFSLLLTPEETLPFTGDYASLYEKSARNLPFSLFRLALDTVEEAGEIRLTKDGYRVVSRTDPTLCFDCDRESMKKAEHRGSEGGLILPLTPLGTLPETADPLPR